MSPKRPLGGHDRDIRDFDDCPKCGKPLCAKFGIAPAGRGAASLVAPRLHCGGCGTVWKLAEKTEPGFVVSNRRGWPIAPVPDPEGN